MYILIKNFEAKKVTKEMIANIILSELPKRKTFESIIELFSQRIFSLLGNINEKDHKKFINFLQTLFQLSDEVLSVFVEKFITMFYSVKIYNQEEENFLKKKLKKVNN